MTPALRPGERAGTARDRRLDEAALGEHPADESRPLVVLRSRPGREGDAGVRAQHAARLAQRGLRIDHEHEAPAAQDAVQAGGVEVDALRVDLLEADVVDPELLRPLLGGGEHLRREVGGDERPARLDELGGQEAGVARAGGELEDRVPGLRVDRVDEPGGDGQRGAAQVVAVRVPAGGLLPPVRAALSALGGGIGHGCGTLAQVGPAQLAGLRARQRLDQLEGLRHLERGEPPGAVVAQLRRPSTVSPGRGTTSAVTASPHSGSARAKTAASATAGCAARIASTSAGATFSPPVRIMSPLRPVTTRRPSGSRRPRSPVRRLPRLLTVGPETRISPSSATAMPTPVSGRPAVQRSPGSATVTVEHACVRP